MHRAIACSLVAAGLVILVLAKFDRQTGFTGLIRFGDSWADRRAETLRSLPIASVAGSSGYDGQFYAQVALDPLLRDPDLATALDSPAYRARRILMPATAATLGLGNPWWTVQIYALLNVVCWGLLGWLLYRQIPSDDPHGFFRWLGCMFSLGVLDSVRQSLVDLPAVLLLVLAVSSHLQSRPARSAFWGSLANLAKETSLLGLLGLYALESRPKQEWRRVGLVLLACIAPIAAWAFYVKRRFAGIPETGLGNFTWPIAGIAAQTASCLSELLRGNFDSRYSFGLIGIAGLVVQACFLWRNPSRSSAWWRIGLMYSLMLLFLSSWVWSGYWAACRAVLPMTIAFNLLLPASRSFWPWWIAGNLAMLHGVWRFL